MIYLYFLSVLNLCIHIKYLLFVKVKSADLVLNNIGMFLDSEWTRSDLKNSVVTRSDRKKIFVCN